MSCATTKPDELYNVSTSRVAVENYFPPINCCHELFRRPANAKPSELCNRRSVSRGTSSSLAVRKTMVSSPDAG